MPTGVYKHKKGYKRPPYSEEWKRNISEGNKGHIPWNKGKTGVYSEEAKRKMGEWQKGKHCSETTKKKLREIHKKLGTRPPSCWGRKLSEETKRKIGLGNSIALKGKKLSEETKRKMSLAQKGKKHSEQSKKKMSLAHSGENNPSWKGGISENPYPKEFNRELKLKVRTRDNFVCYLCGRTEREELEELNRVLCVNHKDFDKNNCKLENLNTLCLKCNVKINREREYWTNYFNNICQI